MLVQGRRLWGSSGHTDSFRPVFLIFTTAGKHPTDNPGPNQGDRRSCEMGDPNFYDPNFCNVIKYSPAFLMEIAVLSAPNRACKLPTINLRRISDGV